MWQDKLLVFHEKFLFSVTLDPWGQSNILKLLKNFLILIKPISKGNFILLIDATIPFSICLHRHSQRPINDVFKDGFKDPHTWNVPDLHRRISTAYCFIR